MTTKSSVKYHYKRLKHAREGPTVYRERPDSVGGGAYYKKKVLDANKRAAASGARASPSASGEASHPAAAGRKESQTTDVSSPYNEYKRPNKGKMAQQALDKLYEDGKFNHLGARFQPGRAIKANAHAMNLPD